MKRLLVPIVLVAALAGCETVPTIPTEVKIPVAIPCKAVTPTPPQYQFETLTPANTIWDKVKVLLSDRELALGYELELQVALASCQ